MRKKGGVGGCWGSLRGDRVEGKASEFIALSFVPAAAGHGGGNCTCPGSLVQFIPEL